MADMDQERPRPTDVEASSNIEASHDLSEASAPPDWIDQIDPEDAGQAAKFQKHLRENCSLPIDKRDLDPKID